MKKILIICGGLQIGGAERVAADLSLYAPPGEYEFHYLIFEGNENVYGAEIEGHGGKVICWPSPSSGYKAYMQRLKQLLEQNKYVAVHSHTMFNSGINLYLARKYHVPVRIAHSHTTRTETQVSHRQKLYEALMRRLIAFSATHFFACGKAAGIWLYGRRLFEKKGLVIHNGIDTGKFAFSPEKRQAVRDHLGLSENFVIGHSGTLVPVKNQEYLIRLMPEICRRIPSAKLLLVGRGDEENTEGLQRVIQETGMEDHVILYGPSLQVHELLNAFDVFAFPSKREGTPLALLEAQANGLPCIVSDHVPTDAFVTGLVQTLSLKEAQIWVDAICSAHRLNSDKYAAFVAKQGCDLKTTYSPVYAAYRGGQRRKQRREAIVAFSFDDGREDNFRVVQDILKPSNLPATFNITTGYVDGTCPPNLRPTQTPAMEVEEVRKLDQDPLFELALHGDRHLNIPEDIAEGRRKLMDWLGREEPCAFGFASPGSGLNLTELSFLGQEPFRSGVTYVRTSLRCKSLPHVRILARKAGRVLHLPIFYKLAYGDTLLKQKEGRILYSVPVMGDTRVSQILALIELCIRRKSAVILMFHSIEKEPQDTWSWREDRFLNLCRYLVDQRKKGNLQIYTVERLYEEGHFL